MGEQELRRYRVFIDCDPDGDDFPVVEVEALSTGKAKQMYRTVAGDYTICGFTYTNLRARRIAEASRTSQSERPEYATHEGRA